LLNDDGPPKKNLDMLPFTAFALESSGSPAHAASNAQTLTLQLPVHPAYAPMSGSATTNQSFIHCGNLLRAAVVPADESALTITF
jgi:hypothetical protein